VRLLLVEDHDMLARAVARELADVYGHDVSWVPSPAAMRQLLVRESFDVVVVDLLYDQLVRDFEPRRKSGSIDLTTDEFLVTGLTALHWLRLVSPRPGVVVWSSGEANRRLHLLFAYEDLKVRVFCSKSSGSGRVDTLQEAITAAAVGRSWVDHVLNCYLPARLARPLAGTLLQKEAHRSIWRAISAGAHSKSEIVSLTHYAESVVRKCIPRMYDELVELDEGMTKRGVSISELAAFGAANWQFFLDDAVRLRYP
jgi:DNA-binding NarL/FixJ family response regulator